MVGVKFFSKESVTTLIMKVLFQLCACMCSLQQAYKLKMYGPGYFWFLTGWYNDRWYLEEDETIDCTREQMAETVESSLYIGTQARLLGKANSTTISGIVR